MTIVDTSCFRMQDYNLGQNVWEVVVAAKTIFGDNPCFRLIRRET